MISNMFVVYLHVVLIECMYVFHQDLSTCGNLQLLSTHPNLNNRLLTATTTNNSNVVLRYHRPCCVFVY